MDVGDGFVRWSMRTFALEHASSGWMDVGLPDAGRALDHAGEYTMRELSSGWIQILELELEQSSKIWIWKLKLSTGGLVV